jgi:hypothetical protein
MLAEAQSVLTERTYAWELIISGDGENGVGGGRDSTSEGFGQDVAPSGSKKLRILSVWTLLVPPESMPSFSIYHKHIYYFRTDRP